MISHIKVFLKNSRSFFSRSGLTIRILGLSRLDQQTDSPGLVMIQIDGLSKIQFDQAIVEGHLPFLKSLLDQEGYSSHRLYSGLPSNTPAVQGELFYGIKGCVPAFSFVDLQSGRAVKMSDSPYVALLETELKKQDEGLLENGSSYCNIFAGGAHESHFCWGNMGWDGFWHAVNPVVFPFLIILYMDIFIRTFFLLVIEVLIAAYECVRGTLKGRVLMRELELIWVRALLCVTLREFITTGVSMDIKRGLPIIHLNLMGYDEQSHCRGPSSRFAHWSLQGIDDAIRRIDHVIKQSINRGYDLWVYSDHGQDKTEPYLIKYGRSLEDAIKYIFKNPQAVVTAMGPLGHIYPKTKLRRIEIEHFSKELVQKAKIPLVLTRLENNQISASTPHRNYILPQDAKEVFGRDHPYLDELTEDIIRVCHHPDAGEFVILGWSKGETAISFPLEYGAHAGAGIEETSAFAFLPMDAPIEAKNKKYLRPSDLRQAVKNFLAQKSLPPLSEPKNLRVMSYNVHGCKGMDGKISIDRIVRVIKRFNPDIITLQELDAGRLRSQGVDQAKEIASKLGMIFEFFPAIDHQKEQFGNAILSRYPMILLKKDFLPKLWKRNFLEPRGALWVEIDYLGTKINIINTHLSLLPKEQLLQIRELLSKDWIKHPDCKGAIILCGDFNAGSNSFVYKEICQRLKDSQLLIASQKPSMTWFTGLPLRRIDHIFVTEELRVNSIQVSHTQLDRLASDHLPLIADFSFSLKAGIH